LARKKEHVASQAVVIYSDCVELKGDLTIAQDAPAVVLFAHGSATGRLNPRNRFIAEKLSQAGFGTLLVDLLTEAEGDNPRNLLDVHSLAHRLLGATEWLRGRVGARGPAVGYFAAGTGSAAAAIIAAAIDHRVEAVVSCSGRPDLAFHSLPQVKAPTLFIVGADESALVKLNRKACERLSCEKRLAVVRGNTHLLKEPGALDEAARLARGWFQSHMLVPRPRRLVSVADLGVRSLGGRLRQRLFPSAAPLSTWLGGSITPAAR
jgi:putative phosphoribosyl transferase